ncbi:flagellar biosynthetic protein FliO [Microbacterium sp. NPDC057407]|uniref:flagellar biosynthetic protein FliO n=1 Tax=Microbacterium sp. NPDC057407 TaxID=3346120 RepID=UPI00366C87BD
MDDVLVAVRAIVSLAAVLGLLMWLRHRIRKGQTADVTPAAATGGKRAALAALLQPRPGARPRKPKPEKITVVSRAGLGGKAQLVVAEFGGIRYVLGVTEHGVNVVDTQEAPAVDEPAPEASEIGRGEQVVTADGGEPALKSVA